LKKLLYASIGTILYVAPIIALYLQLIGGKALRQELEGIRKAIEKLEKKESKNDKEIPTVLRFGKKITRRKLCFGWI
jgi:hypothetical protein